MFHKQISMHCNQRLEACVFAFVNNHIKSWKNQYLCFPRSFSHLKTWDKYRNTEITRCLINYQWLHLAGWAAEGSNVRPGYFRAPSSQPWAQTVLCTILPGSCSCPAVIPPFHPSTNTKYLAVTLHMDPKAGEPEETGGWKAVWTEQVYTISWPSLLVLHEGITSVGMKTCCGYGEESLAQERSTLETRKNNKMKKPNRGITVLSLSATHRLMWRQHLLDGDTTRTSEMSHGQRQQDFFPFSACAAKWESQVVLSR